jgi:hypothetical protein
VDGVGETALIARVTRAHIVPIRLDAGFSMSAKLAAVAPDVARPASFAAA